MPPENEGSGEDPYTLTIAPRFQLRRRLLGRVDRNGGVQRVGGFHHPRNDWRTLEAGELSPLVREGWGPGDLLPVTQLGLFQIPERIRAAWWREAEKSPPKQDFPAVFSALVDFLRFKRLPLPERVHLEVAVNAPNLASTRTGPEGGREGLAYRDAAERGSKRLRQAIGLVNLGDEATYIVLLELPPATLVARLEAAGESGARSLTPHHLVSRFFDVFPRHSLHRVLLEPGEGLWLSPLGVVHDGWTHGKRDLDVVLSLRVELPESQAAAGADRRGGEGQTEPRTSREGGLSMEAPSLHGIPAGRD